MNLTTKQHNAFNIIESTININESINDKFKMLEKLDKDFREWCDNSESDEIVKEEPLYNIYKLFILTNIKAYEYLKKRDIKSMKKCFKLLKDLRHKILEKVEELEYNDEGYLHMSNVLMVNYKTFEKFQEFIETIESMSS